MFRRNSSKSLTILLIIHILFSLSVHAVISPRVPDEKTPGDVCKIDNPHFFEFRYREQIPYCKRSVARSLKLKVYERYKVDEAIRESYTIDHFIPLSIGGSNEEINLWPEHKKIKATRSNLEYEVYLEIKDGLINQEQAIQKIIEAKMNPPQNIESEYIQFKN